MATGVSEINDGIKKRICSLLGKDKGKKQSDVNQKALSKAIGVPEGTLSGWLKKETRRIPADIIIAICKFYGVSPVWLLSGDEDESVSGLSGQEVELLGMFRDLPNDAIREMVFQQVKAAAGSLAGSGVSLCDGEKKEESPASLQRRAE